MILNHQKFDFEDKCLIEKMTIQAPFRFTVNFHNEACFIYFSEGQATVNSPNEQKLIKPEESVLLKCGNFLGNLLKAPVEKYEILVIHLHPDLLREIYKDEIPSFVKNSETKSFIAKVDSHEIIKNFISGLYFYFENPALATKELLELKVKELILLLIQTKNASSIVDLFSNLFTPRTASIKEVVHSHIFSGLSIEDLASLANLSVSTFNRTFQNLYKDTPANYIRKKRLERAKDLLALNNLTISEIAFQTCFNDVAHFSRAYKAAYGSAPTEYRLSLKNR